MNIALITFQDNGAYHDTGIENEDDLLLSFLTAKGLTIEKVIWNDETIDWKTYDLAILKSPWDYFNLADDFYNWLNKLEKLDVKLLNPIETVRWNADKHYLHDIQKSGLNTTPSIFIHKGENINFQDYFKRFNTDKLIIKPCISGGSKNTFKVVEANVDFVSTQIIDLLIEEDFIVQPFLNEIEEHGEWSFIFFGGDFSHALLKKAKSGDFRVQSMFGGTIHPQNPSVALISTAQKYVDQFAKSSLYARVDGTFINDEFVLMELELIEPFLFLELDKNSLDNYYRALLKLTNIDE